jgi:hypothetical protein
MSASVRPWLRLEGAAVLAVAAALYASTGQSWWLFAAVFLAPDLAMLAYLRGPKVGALAYNLAHTYTTYLAVAGAGVLVGSVLLSALGLIGVAHVGFDRTLGYGLKLPSGFHDTHLGPIGRRAKAAV